MLLTCAARVQTLHLLILTDIRVAQSYITISLHGTRKHARPVSMCVQFGFIIILRMLVYVYVTL